ncbi:MAG: oligopeptide transport system ATP-binding protein [Actinomycetota bacterium]|nr:oligopeptide transport system ATP-binding protein [Actinomycetota bacterium]
MPEAPPLLEARDLEVHFPITRGVLLQRNAGAVRAVDGVSLVLERGTTFGLVGESGCGKTTLGRTIVRLYKPTAGAILVDGQDIAAGTRETVQGLPRRLQMIFQDPYASLDPRMTIGACVAEPLRIQRLGSAHERQARVAELLDLVGLRTRDTSSYPHELSGGMRQRVGIARALALSPDIIVADEPVSSLDVSIQAQIVNLLRRLQRDLGLSYLFISHDLSLVRRISDQVAVMYLGRIVESAPPRELYRHPLHPYTVALLSAIPVPNPIIEAQRQRIILTGELPSAANPPSGCRFHTRCWLRTKLGNPEVCTSEDPALSPLAPAHTVACHFASEVDGTPEQESVTRGLGGR